VSSPARRRPRVLLVDDDESLRRALARTIRLAGFEVSAYESAEALLAEAPPIAAACLVLDIDLPGLGGIALRHLLSREGRLPPTVFITALPPADVRRSLATLPCPATVLHKPFGNDALIHAIECAT
jgi:FixJ family two-component response regulator